MEGTAEQRECACGCGESVRGVNANTGQPIRWKKGHWTRHPDHYARLTGERLIRARNKWPEKAELERLLAEMGSTTSVAKHLHMAPRTLAHIVDRYGIAYEPHAKGLEPCNVRLGWAGEEHAVLVLGADLARGMNTRVSPFDVSWQGRRIDVKTARPSDAGTPPLPGWTFNLATNRGKCDAYFCLACDADGIPLRYFLIPEAIAPKILRVPLTLRSKWRKYLWHPEPAELPSWLQSVAI